jgi:hypothetical protein
MRSRVGVVKPGLDLAVTRPAGVLTTQTTRVPRLAFLASLARRPLTVQSAIVRELDARIASRAREAVVSIARVNPKRHFQDSPESGPP